MAVSLKNNNTSVKVLKKTDYNAFGGVMQSYTHPIVDSENPYLYNGKEEIRNIDYNWSFLDYGARVYDLQLGRWHSVDPMVETFQESYTPYHYCLNNPVLHTDPDGKIIPLLAVAAAVAVKAIVGATIDAGTQYVVNRAQGMSNKEALNNLDYTSIVASALIGGATVPGTSTAVKTTITVGALAADALVDASNTTTQVAFGVGGADKKPLTNVVVDATFGVAGKKSSDAILSGSRRSVANDLKPSNFAPLDATGKQTVKAAEKVVNSNVYETAVNAATSMTFGNNGVISSSLKISSSSQTTTISTSNPSTFVMPVYTAAADNTKIAQPLPVLVLP